MKKNKFNMLMLCLIMLSLIVTGCSSSENKDTVDLEKTESNDESKPIKSEIKIGVMADAISLDPQAQNEITASKIIRLIYNQLTTINLETDQVEGELAESWEQVSDTEYKFKIVEGIKFHNGKELTTKDVKYSLERARESARVSQYSNNIKDIEIEDDYNLTIKLHKPSAVFVADMSHNGNSIVPYGVEDELKDNPIGTGPYKLKEHVPGDQITLEKFEDYFKGASPSERLIFRVIPEPSSRIIALETGDVDIAEEISPIDVNKVKDNDELELLQMPGVTATYFGFNLKQKPFDDILVRKAFAHAINKQSIVDAVFNGEGEPAKTVLGTGIIGFYDGMEGFDYNPEKAKELLTEAGYPDGFDTTVIVERPERLLAAQVIQSDLAQVGINLDIEQLESSAFYDTVNNLRQTTYILGWANSMSDPHHSLYAVFHSSNIGPTGNRMQYKNQKVDDLLNKAMVEKNHDKRMEQYKEVQELVVADVPWIPLFHKFNNIGINAEIKGMKMVPSGLNEYENVHY